MDNQLRADSLAPLLSVATSYPDVLVRVCALDAASRVPLSRDGWQRVAEAIRLVVQAEPAASSGRRQALALAVRIPLRSVRKNLRRMAEDPGEPDRDAVAAALEAAGDSRIVSLLKAARTDRQKFEWLAAMPVEEAITPDDVPPLPDNAAASALFWRALVLARLGEYGPLDGFLSGESPWPELFLVPWLAYDRIARIRPIPEPMRAHLLGALARLDAAPKGFYQKMRAHLLGALARLNAAQLTVWAATGIADAEGRPLVAGEERSPAAAPVPTPSSDRVNQAMVLRAQLPGALFDFDRHLTREDFDALNYLSGDSIAALIRDVITEANRRALTLPPGRALIELGNRILWLVEYCPVTDGLPIADLVAEQLRAERPALDDEQFAWIIAKHDAHHLIVELVGLLTPNRAGDERLRILRLLGAVTDCQSGRAGSPWRGAPPPVPVPVPVASAAEKCSMTCRRLRPRHRLRHQSSIPESSIFCLRRPDNKLSGHLPMELLTVANAVR